MKKTYVKWCIHETDKMSLYAGRGCRGCQSRLEILQDEAFGEDYFRNYQTTRDTLLE